MDIPSWLQRFARKPDLAEIRPWLRGAFSRNLGFKVLAVVFAFSGWAMVQGKQVVEQKARVKLQWLLPDDLALVGDLPDSISLTASGSQVFVRDLRRADLWLRVDLSDAAPGVQAVEFEERHIDNLPQNVHVVSLSPARLEFELDERVSKQVKLEPTITGEPKKGLRLVGMQIEPRTVLLEGPAAALVGVTSIPTTPIELDRLERSGRVEISEGVLPDWLHRVDDVPIMVSLDLEPVTASTELSAVPVVVRTKGWTTDVETAGLRISGPVSVIEAIRADKATITITVDPEHGPDPLMAKRGPGPAVIDVVLPNHEQIAIDELIPSTIEVRPVP
jgi:YbbR domain-containing protein